MCAYTCPRTHRRNHRNTTRTCTLYWREGVWVRGYVCGYRDVHVCPPDQSIVHVPLQVNRFQKSILLIVQYKPLKVFYLSFSTNIENPVRKISFSRIWSSTQDYEVLVLLLNPIGILISAWPISSDSKDLYWRCTSNKKASRRGRPLNIFTLFIGSGGQRRSPFECKFSTVAV